MTTKNHTINYIELYLAKADETKAFYSSVFGWEFQDWGDEYISFSGADVDGGFSAMRQPGQPDAGTLCVLFAVDLEATLQAVKAAGQKIHTEIFAFPGGRRFHFIDPNGNELAVWSDQPG